MKSNKVTDLTPSDTESNETYMSICKSLRPLLLGMTICGIYHDATSITDTLKKSEEAEKKKCFKYKLIRYYHLTITILMIINTLRYIPSFWIGYGYRAELTVPRIIVMIWLFQCSVTGIILFVACEKGDHLQEFVYHYNSMLTDEISKCLNFQTEGKKLNNIARMAISTGVVTAMTNSIVNIILCYIDDTESFLTATVNPLNPHNIPSCIIIFILFMFNSFIWIITIFFFLGLSLSISCKFKALYTIFCISSNQNKYPQMTCIKYIRRKHHQLCQAVEIIDRSFKYIIANFFGTSISISMFIAYHLIHGPITNTLTLCIYLFWIISGVVFILILSLSSTNVTYWAHAPLDILYDLQFNDDMAPHQLAELNLFMSRLTAAPIGFTVMGFFTVTKELMLTLAGVFFTYFFLLLQFKID